MKTSKFSNFIPQNIAPYNAKKIVVYNANGARIGGFSLQNLKPPALGTKLYSFGAISDVHITADTAATDFQRALSYLNNYIDVAFTCIAGDLTDDGSEIQLNQYQSVVNQYSPDTPVHAIPGNHEYYNTKSYAYFERITGHPLYYSFEHGDDLFLMIGCYAWEAGEIFTKECLQWMYETLEANRNRRCFIFEHVFPWGDAGNPNSVYNVDLFSGTKGEVFQSLLRHYKNTILFHGHSHTKFELQELDKKANYSEALGYRSVHIPSLAVPRDIENKDLIPVSADSEGYIVDVYSNHIILRGRDFVTGIFNPLASYCLDTTLVNVEEATYRDPTGTIVYMIKESSPAPYL